MKAHGFDGDKDGIGCEFQSPCRESVMKAEAVLRNWANTYAFGFQSPCGESIMKVVILVVGGYGVVFQSPCGESIMKERHLKHALGAGAETKIDAIGFSCQ